MDSPSFAKVFARQLAYWGKHCSLNALPSFGIALFMLKLWRRPETILAMISAIFLVTIVYTVVTSIIGSFSDRTHILARSLHLALKIRLWIVGLSVPLLLFGPGGAIFTPDFWCGFVANGILGVLGRFFFGAQFRLDVSRLSGQSFLPVFAVTLMEGLILSVILMLIAFFSIIFLQGRDRRRRFQGDSPNLL